MERKLLTDISGYSRGLIIVFLGWGTAVDPFSSIVKRGYDILLLARYDAFSAEQTEAYVQTLMAERGYEEICVVAWSLGVKVASQFLRDTKLPVTLRLAVNGSEYHVDDNRGIPSAIFRGTLDGLSVASLRKFLLRTAGSKPSYERFFGMADISEAYVEKLSEELRWFGSLPAEPSVPVPSVWDKAVVSENDRIFPCENLQRAWADIDCNVISGAAHLPDFQDLLNRYVIDKAKVSDKFSAAGGTYSENAVVQKEVAVKLAELIKKYASRFDGRDDLRLLEAGFGKGEFSHLWLSLFEGMTSRILLTDISVDSSAVYIDASTGCNHSDGRIVIVEADADSESFEKKCLAPYAYDIIVSSSMLQWLNSPATFIRRISCAMKEGGVAALSFYTPGTFAEISSIVGNGLQYPSVENLAKVARSCGMKVLEAFSEERRQYFSSPSEALRHLKLTGVNALPSESSARTVRNLIREWPGHELEPYGVALTYCPGYLILSK